MPILFLKTGSESKSSLNKWVRLLLLILISLILANLNCYLFNSFIDIYLTVLIYPICAGNYIFYIHSNGANEIMSGNNNWEGSCISSLEDILNVLDSQNFNKFLKNLDFRLKERKRAISFFNKTRMINQYKKLINSNYKYE